MPRARATTASIRRAPNLSASLATTTTIAALTAVPNAYNVESWTLDKPVSARIGSTNTENTNDCPGPEQKAATVATATTAQP